MIEPRNDRQRKLLKMVQFLSRLLLFGLVFQIVAARMPSTIGLQSLYAGFLSWMLEPLGEAGAAGINISYNGVGYIISQDCLGWKSWFALSGLIASSFNTDFEWRAIGIGGGLIAVALLNTVRVTSTVVLADAGVGFDLLHSITWRWGMTLSILLLWVAWYRQDPELSRLSYR